MATTRTPKNESSRPNSPPRDRGYAPKVKRDLQRAVTAKIHASTFNVQEYLSNAGVSDGLHISRKGRSSFRKMTPAIAFFTFNQETPSLRL